MSTRLRLPLSDKVAKDDELRIFLAALKHGHLFDEFVAFGVLDGTLARDGTATLDTIDGRQITVNGYLVRTGRRVPDSARICAVKWRGTWYAIGTDDCDEAA